MDKDYDIWNEQKKNLEKGGHAFLSFHEREIWWCSLGLNLGDEQDGKNDVFERPVLVLKKFNNRIALVFPMTSKPKFGKFYYPLTYGSKTSFVILSQVRLISVKRFRRFIRRVTPRQLLFVRMKFVELIK
jgi:mRNA-degrading endonuclease toxin of MazEF toxin-antitoxin module